MIYFSSDQHWGHGNIIKMCNRPFTDVFDMNTSMVNSWNSVVTNEDEVYFLGDFTYKCSRSTMNHILDSLNGKKYFIKGNHDQNNDLNWFVSSGRIEWWKYDYEFQYDKYTFILSHYQHQPIRENIICIYGHSHGNSQKFKGGLDVGVDNVGYVPLTIQNIINRIFLIQ